MTGDKEQGVENIYCVNNQRQVSQVVAWEYCAMAARNLDQFVAICLVLTIQAHPVITIWNSLLFLFADFFF